VVGEDADHLAVDLLRHRPVAGAEAGLDVDHRDAAVLGRLGTGRGGVGVPLDHDGPRRVGLEAVRNRGNHRADLPPARHSPDSGEPDGGLRQAHAPEVASGEIVVVVLPGVNEAAPVSETPDDPGQFDDLGPGTEYDSHRTTAVHRGLDLLLDRAFPPRSAVRNGRGTGEGADSAA
jgi:hypothetical protein